MTNGSTENDFGNQKPTHTAWKPIFDEAGNFIKSVSIGDAVMEIGSDGKVSCARVKQYVTPIGYDSGYSCLVPSGEQPPPPPHEVIEDARYEAEQRAQQQSDEEAAAAEALYKALYPPVS